MLALLAEGERKAVARAGDVAALVLADPELVAPLVAALRHADPAVVSHAAHALMTVAKTHARLLAPEVPALLEALGGEQWEILEQLSKILPKLPLDAAKAEAFARRLEVVFDTAASSIARTCALQAMADLANLKPAFRPRAEHMLDLALAHGSKAMQARARKLRAK